jgi:hypothetical protein
MSSEEARPGDRTAWGRWYAAQVGLLVFWIAVALWLTERYG